MNIDMFFSNKLIEPACDKTVTNPHSSEFD